MSKVTGCKFYVFNATNVSLTCSVTHKYHDGTETKLSTDHLKQQTASEMKAFDTGTENSDLWSCTRGTNKVANLKVQVRENNSLVALVVTDWGLTVCPQMNPSGEKAF